jgi:hypothetical protein
MTYEDEIQSTHRSYLFTVRLWAEELGEGQIEWRGQIQYVLSGEIRYFRDWSTLEEIMRGMVSGLKGDETPAEVD